MSHSIHKRKPKLKYKRGTKKFKKKFHRLKNQWSDYNCPGSHKFSGVYIRRLFNKQFRNEEKRKCKDFENENLIIDKKLDIGSAFMWN